MARDRKRAKRRKAKRRKLEQQKGGGVAREAAPGVTPELAEGEEVRTAPEPETAPEPKEAPSEVELAPQPRQKQKVREEGPRHGKVLTFLGEVRGELKRVQWPDRSTLAQGTAVVLAACAIAGLYLGLWDYAWSTLIKKLL